MAGMVEMLRGSAGTLSTYGGEYGAFVSDMVTAADRIEQLERVCASLVAAYARGEAGGSVEWSDLDDAEASAREVFGEEMVAAIRAAEGL